jgi:glutathione S-transferase
MSIVMYDLVGRDDQRFSPYCWRVRLALAHKALEAEFKPVPFTGISKIGDGSHRTVPVIDDNGTLVGDSLNIAVYLDEHYPETPTLFGGARGRLYATHLVNWTNATLIPAMVRMIGLDVHDRLAAEDRDYFRTTREKRLGTSLEQLKDNRDETFSAFKFQVAPLRLTLAKTPYLGGPEPFFGDYAVFGAFQWCRIMSPYQVIAPEDPINEWIERCLDLFGGLARGHAAAG